jgi:hypothetical protein
METKNLGSIRLNTNRDIVTIDRYLCIKRLLKYMIPEKLDDWTYEIMVELIEKK